MRHKAKLLERFDLSTIDNVEVGLGERLTLSAPNVTGERCQKSTILLCDVLAVLVDGYSTESRLDLH